MLYTDIAFVSESLCKLLCELNLTHHASRASLSLKKTEAASARRVSFCELIYIYFVLKV